MIRMLTATYAESVSCTPTCAIGELIGPIENGTTYIVRPCIEPRKRSVSMLRISPGSRQLFVGPASCSRSEQMKVRSSTRATSPGSERARYELGRLASASRSKVPASTSARHRRSYSSADPSHQWTWLGWVSSTVSSTHSSSLACVVGASVLFGTAVSLTAIVHSSGSLTWSGGLILSNRGGSRAAVLVDRSAEGGLEHLGRGALARSHGAVHVPAPHGRSLGARPVDRPDGRAQRRAVGGPATWRHGT